MADADRPRTLLWIDGRQARFASEIAEVAGLEIAGVAMSPAAETGPGGPSVAELFPDATVAGDLRAALADLKPDLALFLSAHSAEPGAGRRGPHPLVDESVLQLCESHSVARLTIEPAPASLEDMVRLGSAPATVVPLFRDSPGFLDAEEALEQIGGVRSASVTLLGGAFAGSLGARLFDAMRLLHALLGVPESIDAAHVPADARAGASPAASGLLELAGDLTAHLRFAGARAAVMCLSSRGGLWFRGATLVGETGRMRLDEKGFEVIGPDGQTMDRSEREAGPPEVRPAAWAVGGAIRRVLDRRSAAPPPAPLKEVLAMCEAALLSAHTGQSESPHTAMAMARA